LVYWKESLNRQERQDAKTERNDLSGLREPSSKVDELAHQVIGAAIEVHKVLGPGLLESVYEEALAIELDLRDIPYERQKPISLQFKGKCVGESRLDFLIGGELVVELKAVEAIHPIFPAKVIHYLKISGLQLGLIINFHVVLLKDGIKRVALTHC
jgi:GxxExxY protein